MRQPRESDSEREYWKFHEVDSGTRNRIEHLITHAESELEILNLEIAQERAILNGLLLRHQTDTARIDFLRFAISPIKKIPVEILSKIFVYCRVKTKKNDIVFLPPQRGHYPWPLAHVCSRWRRVIWNTPEIWSRINCGPPQPSAALRHVLSCTSGLIGLSIYCTSDDSLPEVVSCYAKRFKRLTLEDSQLAQISTPLVSLEALNILHNKDEIKLLDYSNLLPWAQLVELYLHGIMLPPSALHSTLSKCNSIVICTAYITTEPLEPVVAHRDIVLHELKSLSLRLMPGFDMSHFFRPFVFMALEDLTINAGFYCIWPREQIIELVQRSHCRLKQISIKGAHRFHKIRQPVDMAPLFQVTPSLIAFDVPFIVPSSTFEQILPHGLAPHIKSFECYVLPEGLHAFLDSMEYSTREDSQESLGGLQSAKIGCLKDSGFEEAFNRFNSLAPKYETEGRKVQVYLYS